MRAIGLSFNWVVKKLFAAEYEAMGDKVFAWIDEQVADIAPGSEGLIGLPWFHGDHPPYPGTEARGCFINLDPSHDRRHMARSIMEGVCYHLKMRATSREYDWPKFFSAIGGGSCSDVWMQMLADVMNTQVRVPADTRHAGAIGTAYSALIGLGECSDYGEAAQRIRFERTFDPRPEAVAAYEKSYAAFLKLAETLKPICTMLNSKETEVK
jgi:xylulokinase